jgi:hypothetical protein
MKACSNPANRAAAEDMIELLAQRLDAMDGDPHMELDQDGELEDAEESQQALTLAHYHATDRRIRKAA